MHESAYDAVQSNGAVPPGNARNSSQQWVRKTPRAKPELKLTPGKGLQDLTCSVEDLLDTVVKSNKVGHHCICQLLTLHLSANLQSIWCSTMWCCTQKCVLKPSNNPVLSVVPLVCAVPYSPWEQQLHTRRSLALDLLNGTLLLANAASTLFAGCRVYQGYPNTASVRLLV